MKGKFHGAVRRLERCALLLCFFASVAAAKVPGLVAIPDTLPDAVRAHLEATRKRCEGELESFQKAAGAFNAKKAEDQTDAEYGQVQSLRRLYVEETNAFNDEVRRDLMAAKAGWSTEDQLRLARDPNKIDMIEMHALAERLGWSEEKRERLDRELGKLVLESQPGLTPAQVAKTWQDIEARGEPEDVVRDASAGKGISMGPGAGMQGDLQDCTVFAIANATGRPYGFVAARAGELIRDAGWHTEEERQNPQKLIEGSGLCGGEVLMLAEAFGEGTAVHSVNFAKTLSEGRPIMIDVFPDNWDGRIQHSHEVVLTRTFTHNGETWFAMADSRQGPQRQLFLSARELDVVLKDTGVAFNPDKGTTPILLRPEGSP